MTAASGDNVFAVAVIGGGPAGIAAALAASAGGSRVLLVEGHDRPGGNVTQALVHTICGLYLPSSSARAEYAHAGLPRLFAERMIADGHARGVDWAGSAGFLAIDPDGFAATAAICLASRPSLTSWMRAKLASLEAPSASSERWRIVADRGDGLVSEASAWTVVDTTGDANAAAAAGVATEMAPPDELQHSSCIVRIDGVDSALFDRMERARTSAFLAREAKQGRLPQACASVVFRPGLGEGSFFATMNLAKPPAFDPLDAASIESLRSDAVAAAMRFVALLVRERRPLRRAVLAALPARVGIRETRRVRGAQRLEAADVLAGRRRDDEACVSTWPVELWSSASRLDFRPASGPSSIPLGCLIADHPSRRFAMAGRCASASHEALGAIRVIATSMAMGEAAGVACALAASRGSDLSAIDAAEVRDFVSSGRTGPC